MPEYRLTEEASELLDGLPDHLGPAIKQAKDDFLEYIPEERREEFNLALTNVGIAGIQQMVEGMAKAFRTAWWDTTYSFFSDGDG